MRIETEDRSTALVVVISGSVDGLSADALETTLREQMEAGHTRVVADLGDVEYTSSAGLRALLATVKEARRRGGDLRLASLQPNVRKILDLSGFTSILKVYDGVEDAVGSFAGTARA